eukprot:TRINITY_DN3257_c0_g1_i2.p1 TRINITY_DN3257_c0_g1~~TRINITY_DN3257_c0_g1_i2.p1  ORF type:complete len:215 (-),score=33.20 TRINITY_DN3257_c0_g1_i2:313-957(-)
MQPSPTSSLWWQTTMGSMISDTTRNWGQQPTSSPTLDSLAAQGVKLESHYAQPMCSPTRGALLSGRIPSHTGYGPTVLSAAMPYAMPKAEKLLPEILRDNGYQTHLVGKWHMGHCDERYSPTFRGFNTYFGYLIGAEDYYTHIRTSDGFTGYDLRNGSTVGVMAKVANENNRFLNYYSTELFSAEATRVIAAHAATNGTAPLFLSCTAGCARTS